MKKILLFCKIYRLEVSTIRDFCNYRIGIEFRAANKRNCYFAFPLEYECSLDEIADKIIHQVILELKLDRRLLEENDEYQVI